MKHADPIHAGGMASHARTVVEYIEKISQFRALTFPAEWRDAENFYYSSDIVRSLRASSKILLRVSYAARKVDHRSLVEISGE